MDELKDCPFCSGKRVDYDSVLFTKKGKVIYAKCPDCGTSFRVLEHMYNNRPLEDKLAAEITKLEHIIDDREEEIRILQDAVRHYSGYTTYVDKFGEKANE
jgi:hypothetical protein